VTGHDRIELVLLAALWGASFLFMRVAVPEFGVFALVEIRVAVAALFLLGVLALRGQLGGLRRDVGALTFLGAINSALPFALFAYATLYVTAGTAAVLNASVPLFGGVVAFVWLHDRLTPARIAGLAVGFAGVMILVWDKISFNGSGTASAIFAALAASLAYAIAANFAKKRLSRVDPILVAGGSTVAASVLLAPLAIATWPDAMPSLVAWLCAIGLAVGGTGIAYILYFRLIARIGPAKAIAVTYLVPVFGMLWGLLILREPITVTMLIACAVILLGTALATGALIRSAPRKSPSAAVQSPPPCP
jgi:drug/metabolite transporter (DMT)-like permease